MHYSIERKIEIINGKPNNMDVSGYCKNVGIANSSYYKWLKEIKYNTTSLPIVDVTELVNATNSNSIDIELNGIIIHIDNNYVEKHLLNVIRSLKKL